MRVRGQRPSYVPVEDAAVENDEAALLITYAGYISTDFTIAEGQALDLNYELKNTDGSSTITWSSADPSVVHIDQNGTVTGIKAGKYTTIYATNGSLTASCVVRVSN